MTLFDQYGIKEVADVTLYSIHKKEDGSGGIYYLPALYLDTLKVSTIEKTAGNTWATGGEGNARLINWDFEKTINITLDDALCTPASLGLCWNGVLSANWKDGKVVLNEDIDNSIKKISRMEKAYAPRRDPIHGTIGHLLPKIKSDDVDNYFGTLRTSAVIDGTDIRGFGTVNGHTYKWKMIIESLVKSIAVVPDRFFDINGRSYRIDWNRKISVNSLPDYENYKDAIIYKINNKGRFVIPEISKLIYDAGEEDSLENDILSIFYLQTDRSEPVIETLFNLIKKNNTAYKIYEENLIAEIDSEDNDVIKNIYIPQEDLNNAINEDNISNRYEIVRYNNNPLYVESINESYGQDDIIKGFETREIKIVEVNVEPPSSYVGEETYNPIPYNTEGLDINTGDYVIFIPSDPSLTSTIDYDSFYKIFKVGEENTVNIPNTNTNEDISSEVIILDTCMIHELTEINLKDSNNDDVIEENDWDVAEIPVRQHENDNSLKLFLEEHFPSVNFMYAIIEPLKYYTKDLEVYKVKKDSILDLQIRGAGLKTETAVFSDSLNRYLWNHRVDMIDNSTGTETIEQSEKTYNIEKADYLAIIIDNNNNYIPLIGVVVNEDGTIGYKVNDLYKENEPLPTEETNQLVWFNPCPMIDVSQFKGLDLWQRFENLNELIYFLITKYEENIISISAATLNSKNGYSVNQKTTEIEYQTDLEADKVRGKLWAYINPKTMQPYSDDYWFNQGESYYIKSLTLVKNNKKINGNKIVIKSGEWPGIYMMVGETWIRNRDTGKDMRLQIKIPKCKVKSDHTLTLQSEGDPTVFSLNLEVAQPQNGEIMEIIAYEIAPRMEQDEEGRMYAVDGSSEVVIE